MNAATLSALVPALANRRVVVVGDVILDEYIFGKASRLSREAPIPVLEFERREYIPGGAANPAANIAALGSTAIQVGVMGQDGEADRLCEALKMRGIDPAGLVSDPSRSTTVKTRILAQMGLRFPQQMARIDHIDRHPVAGEVEQAVIARIESVGRSVDTIMVSDYLTGLLTPAVVDAVRHAGQETLITADAQGELDKYAGFDVVKCNADEAARYFEHPLQSNADFAAAGRAMVERLRVRGGMLITRGPEGVTLAQRTGQIDHIPAAHIEDVYDTVGAGDTALAVVTLALAAGAAYPEAARLATLAAGIVVRKVGNYAPSPAELLDVIREQEA